MRLTSIEVPTDQNTADLRRRGGSSTDVTTTSRESQAKYKIDIEVIAAVRMDWQPDEFTSTA